MKLRSYLLSATITVLVGVLWIFPRFWYTQSAPEAAQVWLRGTTNIDGWTYRSVPVNESAERTLVADALVNGDFTNSRGQIVRVFSANRFVEKENEIGLFVHTPDRCWTEAGWKIDPLPPEQAAIDVAGLHLNCERRVFVAGDQRELVYFFGLVGGRPLPYRLDHNLSVGMRYAVRDSENRERGASLRASDSLLWERVWDSFWSRRPLLGPKQFIRISTPVRSEDYAAADRRLREMAGKWLLPESR